MILWTTCAQLACADSRCRSIHSMCFPVETSTRSATRKLIRHAVSLGWQRLPNAPIGEQLCPECAAKTSVPPNLALETNSHAPA